MILIVELSLKNQYKDVKGFTYAIFKNMFMPLNPFPASVSHKGCYSMRAI